MKELLKDFRVRRLILANTTGSIGSGITIFSVPWLMVHRLGGNDAFRWATAGTTLILFLFMPYYGAWIDRHSRKTMLLASEGFGFCATLSMALLGLATGGFGLGQLVAIYFFGMLYYTLHYPAKFAFIQQIFERPQYQPLMGLLEIQGQTAMMVAGGLGGILVDHVPLWAILLFDASTYLFSFIVQSTLPYEATHLAAAKTDTGGTWKSVGEGWRWLKERPDLAVFLTCALIPFVVVMASNYLFPIYVSQTLHAKAWGFAGGEITFALGAIGAGLLLPKLLQRNSADRTIPGTMLASMAGLALIVIVHSPAAYFAGCAIIGFGNAGCRVARSALLLHVVPNAVMGRVGIFYNVVDRIFRTLLVSAMGIIDLYGPPSGFLLLFGVLLLALAGVWRSRGAPALNPATA